MERSVYILVGCRQLLHKMLFLAQIWAFRSQIGDTKQLDSAKFANIAAKIEIIPLRAEMLSKYSININE